MKLVTYVIQVCVGVLKWQQLKDWILKRRIGKDILLVTNIPEFNPEFPKATKTVQHAGLDFWWENTDVKSRLNAFEVLEGIYKESVREFEY